MNKTNSQQQEMLEKNEYTINRYWIDNDDNKQILEKMYLGSDFYSDVIEAFTDMEGCNTNIERIYLAPEPENDFVCIVDYGGVFNDKSYIIIEKAIDAEINRGLSEILYNENSYTAIQGQILPMFEVE